MNPDNFKKQEVKPDVVSLIQVWLPLYKEAEEKRKALAEVERQFNEVNDKMWKAERAITTVLSAGDYAFRGKLLHIQDGVVSLRELEVLE